MTDLETQDLEESEDITEEQVEEDVTVIPGDETASPVADESTLQVDETELETGVDLDELKRMELFKGVSFQVTVELGRKGITFGEVLKFGKGSVIELDKLADDPVDIYVNQSKIAEGEVVVIDEYFGVRITKLLEANPRN